MQRTLLLLLVTLMPFFALQAKEYDIYGPQGGLSCKISLPDGFRPETDRCPMVILMHGIFSSEDYNPMPALAKGLARAVDFFRSVFRLDPMQGVMMQEMTDQR